jgi:hypothetical protein
LFANIFYFPVSFKIGCNFFAIISNHDPSARENPAKEKNSDREDGNIIKVHG